MYDIVKDAGGAIDERNVPQVEPKNPIGTARAFLATHPWQLARLNDRWWLWTQTRYIPLPVGQLESKVWKWLEEVGTFAPTPKVVGDLLKALAAILSLPPGTEMPRWLGRNEFPAVEHVIPLANGLLDIGGEPRLLPHSPYWLSACCLPHPYDPEATCPQWEAFLDDVFEGDADRVRSMQQWFGYNLTLDIRQHKFAMLVGPPGSGKSTTLRVLGEMLGQENVATPTLTTLWRFYGMETIYTKMAALMGDAHLDGAGKAVAILEKLKSVVGADRQNVDRKGKDELANVTVRARFTLAVNEMPQLPDSANALRRRMLVIPFNRSFAGREDHGLGDRLEAEMTGIVAWSLRGLVDLRASGRLHHPPAGKAVMDEFCRLSSPIREFVTDSCVLSPDAVVPTETLWAAWKDWCGLNGHRAGNESRFGVMLRGVDPRITRARIGRNASGRQIYHYAGVDLARRRKTAAIAPPLAG